MRLTKATIGRSATFGRTGDLQVDAVMEGPRDRKEADTKFRDLVEHLTGRRPGPGWHWSLRPAPSN